MKRFVPSRKRALRWLIGLVVVALIGVYILLPVGAGVYAVLPFRDSVGEPPDGFRAVAYTAEDGVELAAWYAPPDNGAVIIVLHGGGGPRTSVTRYAEMLRRHNYGVLVPDLRGYGESEGTTNRFGWQGTLDVSAAVAFLHTQPDVDAIGGLGLSLGGEVLLGAASANPAITAIAADGATRRSIEELRALESERPLVRNFVQRVMFFTVALLTGDDPPDPTLLESMAAAEDTAFLLIAGGEENQEIDFNELFVETVGARATLWIVPGASHTHGFGNRPDEYEQRVTAFFDAHLLAADATGAAAQ